MSDNPKDFKNNNGGGYSQYGEDIPLKQILPQTGYFLEIGAFCPYIFSNTRFLVEMGWGGCYVDGSASAIQKFIEEYKENNNIQIVQALVGDADKFVEFYDSIGDAISTTDENHMIKWKSGGHDFRKVYTNMITPKTLETILPKIVDFINIDVEGQSAYLATLIDYDNLNTKVVCIEHDNQIDILNNYLDKFNFKLTWLNHTNAIFTR